MISLFTIDLIRALKSARATIRDLRAQLAAVAFRNAELQREVAQLKTLIDTRESARRGDSYSDIFDSFFRNKSI